jgi:hypothetical protein
MTDNTAQSVLNKQRLDKFRLVLTLPNVLRDLNSSDWKVTADELINRDSLQFSLHGATIPEVSIPSKILPTQGQSVKVTSQSREPYVPVTCKFVIDNRFRNYWVLWKWLEMINDPRHSGMDDSLALENPSRDIGQLKHHNTTDFWGYQTKISIFPLDEYNKDMCEFIFYNAFITKLSGVIFSYQDATQAECDFTFDFGQMDLRIIE